MGTENNERMTERRLDMIDNDIQGLRAQQRETQDYLKRLTDSQDKMAESMGLLTQVVVKQDEDRKNLDRLYGDHREIAKRVQAIEIVIPPLVESRGWVVKWVIGIVTIAAGAVLSLDIHKIIGGGK